MANGPFGNPLSTGIALSFEVDMTPYRQMHARKMANIEEKKKERKKQQAELQDILKNITVDTSKVHERYKDDAMNEYAATINDVMSSFKSGNVAGTYQRINKFNNQINSYVAATQNFNDYVKSKGENTFRNDALISAMNDVEGVSDDRLMEMFQNDIDYSNGLFNFTVIDRPDLIGHANKVLQGVEKQYVRDASGNIVASERFGDKGTKLYKTSIPDVEQFITEESNWLKNSAGGNRLLMEYGGITPAQLDERQADGRQLRDVLAEDYVRKTLSNKLYGEKEKEPWKPESKTGGEKTFEEKYRVEKTPTFVDIKVDQNSGIPANSKMISIPFNPLHDVNSTKWDYRKTIEISDNSYQTVQGNPIGRPSKRGPGVKEMGAVPMGIYALKGPSDKRIYAGYLFTRKEGGGPERNVMHYQPLDPKSLDQQYVREFIDASGISVDDYIEYYDAVAKKAGFPVSSYGGSSAAGTPPSGGNTPSFQ
jgi:hypothetical protein